MINLDTGCLSNYLQVSNRRNAAMHSSTLSFTDNQMKDALTKMINVLKNILRALSAEKDRDSIKKEIEKTIEILNEVSTNLLTH